MIYSQVNLGKDTKQCVLKKMLYVCLILSLRQKYDVQPYNQIIICKKLKNVNVIKQHSIKILLLWL